MSKIKRKFNSKNKTKKIRSRHQGNTFLSIFLLILVAVLILGGGVCYLSIVNRDATSGYLISDLEQQLFNLKNTNQKLEVQTIELGQVNRIKQQATENLQMVKSESVDYLTVHPNEVAVR